MISFRFRLSSLCLSLFLLSPALTAPILPDPYSTSTTKPSPTYIPPPKADLTPELIQQSLSQQNISTAIISGVTPHFQSDVLTYIVQLTGLVADSLPMNASTLVSTAELNQRSIMRVTPKSASSATPFDTPTLARVRAVSYQHSVLTYWLEFVNGSVIALSGDNQVHAIDEMDPKNAELEISVAQPQ